MKIDKRFPIIPAAFAFMLIILLAYFLMESSKWYDYSKKTDAENARLNATLAVTQEKLANETYRSNTLYSELETTNATLKSTNSSLTGCKYNLTEKTDQLGVCTSRNEELTTFLLETKDELGNLSTELNSFQEQIQQSMSWFSENSNLSGLSPHLQYLVDHCTSNTEINLACIPVVMNIEEDWNYKLDQGDRLLSLEEFANNDGGDCEDWALYFKAAYNYLKKDGRPERKLVAVMPGSGIFKIYGNHYYGDASAFNLGTSNENIYVICYDSHCIVAISGQEIKNSSDVYKLHGAHAVEPQNGQYMFDIGDIGAPDICSSENCGYNDIWIVITDDDIYDFHYNQKWVCYGDYYELASYYKNNIDAMNTLIKEKTN